MQQKSVDATAEDWARRKMYSEEFFHACMVDEDTAILVREAEIAGSINMAAATQLWTEIAAGIRFHHYPRC